MRSSGDVIRADFERYLKGRAFCARLAWRALLRYPGLQAVLVYRFGRAVRGWTARPWCWPLLPMAALLYMLAAGAVRLCYGIWLLQSAEIGSGLSILHFGGIEIANCRMGENCSVAQQSKIGSRFDTRGPRIGDGVWIGAHARVRGPVTIGDGATIAPAACVTRAVPRRGLVVGDPARLVFPGFDNASIQPRG